MGRDFAQDRSCPNKQPVRSLFVCKHKQGQPLNTDALVRGGPKPPAGTLQAEGRGAGFKKQPHLPRRAALFMDTGCSRHREERPGEEVEGLGAGWMLTAQALFHPVTWKLGPSPDCSAGNQLQS